jgi:flagellar basal body P-ring formation protein FlgA
MKSFALVLTLTALALPAMAQNVAVTTLPVLKQGVSKGEVITADNLVDKQIPTSQVFASTITDGNELSGQEATRTLAAGAPINKLHVRVAPAISKNDLVSIRYQQGSVELVVKGQALEDGQVGQSIRVLNPGTRTTLVGIVGKDNVVEVN